MKISTYVSAMSIYGQSFAFKKDGKRASMCGEHVFAENTEKLNPGIYIAYDRLYKLSFNESAFPYLGSEPMCKAELEAWLETADTVTVTVSYDDGCPDWEAPGRIIVVK